MGFFGKVKSFLVKAFKLAQAKGLTDVIVQDALQLAKAAEAQFKDDAQKREWVVAALTAAGVPSSVARIAVEMAVHLMKSGA
jgi:hypothetical protein